MAYLVFTQKKQLLLIHHSTKNGVYSQTLSSNGLSRPISIHRNYTHQYSVALDHNHDLHIITQPSPEQIIHLHYKDQENVLTRKIVLEDPKGIYNFSNLFVTGLKEHVHLFYTAKQPNRDSYDLIHHILCPENKSEPYPIMSFPKTPLGFRCMGYSGTLYMLYGDISDKYSLYLITYEKEKWESPQLVSSSDFPIDDFQFCIDSGGTIHLVYVQEKYGRSHLIYKKKQNTTWSDEILLHTTPSGINPSIFTYQKGLWVTYVENNQLQMILSMDYGSRFSKSVTSSLPEGELEPCHFVWDSAALPNSFNGNMLYALISPTIRIGVISHIDMIGLHPDLRPNTEMELFIDGIFYSQTPSESPNLSTDLDNLRRENVELKQAQEEMIRQYNEMTELTKKIQEEGRKWRSKALAQEETKE